MNWRWYSLVVVCACVCLHARAQVCQTVGNIITVVSTDPATGHQLIQWQDPPSLLPSAVNYIIYEYLGGSTCTQEITRVPITQHSYTHPVIPTAQMKYTIAVDIGTAYPEPITHEHGAAFIHTYQYDPCLYSVHLKWDAYVGWSSPPLYRVYASSDGITWDLKGSTGATEYTIEDTPDNVYYGIYVEAVNAGNTTITSRSNTCWLTTTTPQRPAFLTFSSIDSRNGEALLTFSIDAAADPAIGYAVERSPMGENNFQQRFLFDDKTLTNYTDNEVTAVFDYRVVALSTCGAVVRSSDTLNNIILSIAQQNAQCVLHWSALNGVGVRRYDVEGLKPATGNLALNLTDTSFTTPAPDMSAEPSLDMCYRVTAHRAAAVSITTNCINFQPDVRMPDAINPYSTAQNPTTQRRRNQFGPVVNAHPSTYTYRMEIYTRNGTLIARIDKLLSDDPLEKSWNGTHQNGHMAREDVYVYSIKISLTSGEIISKTGSVTVIAER